MATTARLIDAPAHLIDAPALLIDAPALSMGGLPAQLIIAPSGTPEPGNVSADWKRKTRGPVVGAAGHSTR